MRRIVQKGGRNTTGGGPPEPIALSASFCTTRRAETPKKLLPTRRGLFFPFLSPFGPLRGIPSGLRMERQLFVASCWLSDLASHRASVCQRRSYAMRAMTQESDLMPDPLPPAPSPQELKAALKAFRSV